MIRTTTDTREFIENHNAPIFIYGAGNPGSWVARYMKRCGIGVVSFLDKCCLRETDREVRVEGIKVFHPAVLEKYRGRCVRIVIAVHDVGSALAELHWCGEENELYCLLPYCLSVDGEGKQYDINGMLAYFRSKLLVKKVPTILSNQCDAGMIYHMLGVRRESPLINLIFKGEDFIRLCKEPQKYLERDMEEDGYSVINGRCYPCGKINDISVILRHDLTAEKGVERWKRLKDRVDYSDMIFILSDAAGALSWKEQQDFLNLPGKKLLILTHSLYGMRAAQMKDVLYLEKDCFVNFDEACENYFDILGWINGEF